MDIATWAWEYWKIIATQLSIIVTVHRCIKKCNLKLYYAKTEGIYRFLRRNATEFSGPEVIWDGPKEWLSVHWSDESTFQLVLGENRRRTLCAKDEKDHPDHYNETKSAKNSLCDGMGVHQCPRHGWSAYMWRYHWCRGLFWNFGETYAAVKRQLFPGTPCPFQQDNARPHSASVTTAWHRHRVRVLDWPACSPDLSPIDSCIHDESQTKATMDSWAAQVLYTPRIGKNSTCKTATIDIFSSQTITKCN